MTFDLDGLLKMKKKIIYNSIIYTALGFLFPLGNFLLLPIFTSYLTEAKFGEFSILNNLNLFTSIIGGLGISSAVTALYPTYIEEKDLVNRYIGNVMQFTFLVNLVLFLIILLFGQELFGIIFKSEIGFYPNGLLAISYGLMYNSYFAFLIFIRLDKRVLQYAIISIMYFLLIIFSQYYMVAILKWGVYGIFYARFFVTLIFLCSIFFYFRKFIFKAIDFNKLLKPSLRYSFFIVPTSILTWFMNFSDRFYIERFIDLGNVGVYSLLFIICSLSDLVVFSIGSGVQPYLFDYFKDNNKTKINAVYKLWVSTTVIVISAIILLGSHLNLIIHKKSYMEIPSYLPIMILGFIFSAFAYLLNLQITYAKKSVYFFKSNLILVLLNLVSCYFFVSRFGIWGAVISSLLTKFAFNLISVYYVNKIFSTKVNRDLILFIITTIVVIVFFWMLAFYKILSFSTASILQFFICMIIVGKVMYPYFRELLFKKSHNLLINKE